MKKQKQRTSDSSFLEGRRITQLGYQDRQFGFRWEVVHPQTGMVLAKYRSRDNADAAARYISRAIPLEVLSGRDSSSILAHAKDAGWISPRRAEGGLCNE